MNVYFKDFKHLINGNNSSLAVFEAISACKDGDTLIIDEEKLHFYNDCLFTKEYYISNNDYSMKSIAFPLIKKNNLVIDGGGCKLIFHGKISPFVIDSCNNITIKNLSIDYAEPMYFQAHIVDAGDDFVLMKYDSRIFHCDIENDKFVFSGDGWKNEKSKVLAAEFDPTSKSPDAYAPPYIVSLSKETAPKFLGGMFKYLNAVKPAPDMLRLEGNIGHKHKVGNCWLCTHNDRKNPGILVTESKNVFMQGITLNHTLSMGVICQLTENITLDRVIAVPSYGRMLSVDADATHFVNCSGTIHLKNCRFESMMDDACNVHGIYMLIERKLSVNQMLLKFGHLQQFGINIFKPGDIIRLVEKDTMNPYSEFTVKSASLISGKYIVLETIQALPENINSDYVVENHTRMPYFHAENCSCGRNRPRGFLITTCNGALVEGCKFYNMNQGIEMNGGATDWFESGPCDGVIIKNNDFTNSAYAGGFAIVANPRIHTHTQPYHKNINVEDNIFRMHEKRIAYLHDCQNIVFKNNVFVCDKSLPSQPHPEQTESGFVISNCNNIDIEPLKE